MDAWLIFLGNFVVLGILELTYRHSKYPWDFTLYVGGLCTQWGLDVADKIWVGIAIFEISAVLTMSWFMLPLQLVLGIVLMQHRRSEIIEITLDHFIMSKTAPNTFLEFRWGQKCWLNFSEYLVGNQPQPLNSLPVFNREWYFDFYWGYFITLLEIKERRKGEILIPREYLVPYDEDAVGLSMTQFNDIFTKHPQCEAVYRRARREAERYEKYLRFKKRGDTEEEAIKLAGLHTEEERTWKWSGFNFHKNEYIKYKYPKLKYFVSKEILDEYPRDVWHHPHNG